MQPEKRPTDESLLDFHLDRLEGEERSWIEAELRRDRELQQRSSRLGRILQPLDHWRPAPGPAHLPDKVLSHVREMTQPQRRGWRFHPGGGGRPSWRMRDLIGVAACLALLAALAVPGFAGVRDRAQRTMCADNLRSVFVGASSYQQAFAQSLPYAGGLTRASWLPGADAALPYASNSRHPFLLIKLKYGPKPKDFLCPGRCGGEATTVDQLETGDDFATARNVSYDSLNLSGLAPNVRPPAALAYMSDANPLFVGARFNDGVDPVKTNSPAHRGRGQTVLRLDGNVQFTRTPVYAHGDNLWTIGDVRRYSGTESATRPDDAFLVPGYPASQQGR